MPMSLGFNHRIQDREELAHRCRHRHFLGFPSREQPLIEGFDHWVNTSRGQRGHVQDRPDFRAPAANMARAGSLAAIVIEWGDPYQLRDFALVEHT